ncbi:MAG: hypothetical protein A2Z29_10230 [Chloroflexi bacterium RBG_16_56_11]|nr:MAG: hypothetical protein A2Z29_10230 [Chloroflexi bacterium RBG_16_56_11]
MASVEGLKRVTLPQGSEDTAFRQLNGLQEATSSPARFTDLAARLRRYYEGHQVALTDKLDLSGATLFQESVWLTVGLIPYGQTRSYGWIAGQIGNPGAARAVGQALGSNPLPVIIPCHRVLTADGGVGGFSGGLEMKRFLLGLERGLSVRDQSL